MATNQRVDYTSNDLDAGQQSPSQASRTQYYPGKAVSRAGDMTWEKDNRIPQGTPAFGGEAAGPVEMQRSRVVKLGRNIVDDQTVLEPTVTGTRVEAVASWSVHGTNTTTDTENPANTADRERQAGDDNIVGA